jgi:hypothetical protein
MLRDLNAVLPHSRLHLCSIHRIMALSAIATRLGPILKIGGIVPFRDSRRTLEVE